MHVGVTAIPRWNGGRGWGGAAVTRSTTRWAGLLSGPGERDSNSRSDCNPGLVPTPSSAPVSSASSPAPRAATGAWHP